MRITYTNRRFQKKTLAIIEQANEIIEEYRNQGFDLTLRQLYYQFVARDLLPNSDKSYKRLGNIITDARLAGLVDWDAIVDRTRSLRRHPHWDDPSGLIATATDLYATDLWADQSERVEVWIEKDALVGVIADACEASDVSYFSCRGYTSVTAMWDAAQRHLDYQEAGQKVTVIHLGDHDPSGIDMTRDIQDRLDVFGASTHVERIALTMEQVNQYNPPPNPAKPEAQGYKFYRELYGPSSWELDALDPATLNNLVTEAIAEHRDDDLFASATEAQEVDREILTKTSRNWDEVARYVESI